METWVFVIYILALSVLVKFIMGKDCCGGGGGCEGLVSRPNVLHRESMASDVLQNKHIFQNDKLNITQIRHRMPWMDAVVFEDLRKLVRENKFAKENIYNVLGG